MKKEDHNSTKDRLILERMLTNKNIRLILEAMTDGDGVHSAYGLSVGNSNVSALAYKNILKYINELKEMELIEPVKTTGKHNAILLQLTEKGKKLLEYMEKIYNFKL